VSRAAIFICASIASMSTAAIGLNPDIRRPDSDIRLLMDVAVEDLLSVEVGEVDLGVESSELELL
jgi:hypothetical protein